MTDETGFAAGVAALGTAPWADEAPGIDARSTMLNDVRWAIVRYAPGAEREEWCTDGHRGYVLDGAISYELEQGGRLGVPRGAGFWLPPGSGHRGVNGDQETTIFLVDVPDVTQGAPG